MVLSDRYLTLNSRSIKSLWDINPKISCFINFKTSVYNSALELYSLSLEHLGISLLYFIKVQNQPLLAAVWYSGTVLRDKVKREKKKCMCFI